MQTNLKNWWPPSTSITCLFLTMSLVVVPVLTTPLPTPLIITFGDSNAVHTAENTLDARVSAIAIEYSNPLKALYLIRARTLIIIGHGGLGSGSVFKKNTCGTFEDARTFSDGKLCFFVTSTVGFTKLKMKWLSDGSTHFASYEGQKYGSVADATHSLPSSWTYQGEYASSSSGGGGGGGGVVYVK